MRLSIRNNGNYVIDFDQFQIHGRRAVGAYAFIVILKGRRQSCEPAIFVSDISISLCMPGPTTAIVPTVPSLTRIIKCQQYADSEHLSFEMVLTREQVNALEEYRQDGDLKLNIALRAMTSSDGEMLTNFDHCDISVPREQWLKALNDSGFRQTILFEVPVQGFDSDLSKFVSKAQEFIELGHYKDAVKQCRQIIEQIENTRGDKQNAMQANKKSQNKEGREAMTVIERMLCMREQIKNICQLGAHGNEDFTRSQAKAVLGATLALLSEPTIGFLPEQE